MCNKIIIKLQFPDNKTKLPWYVGPPVHPWFWSTHFRQHMVLVVKKSFDFLSLRRRRRKMRKIFEDGKYSIREEEDNIWSLEETKNGDIKGICKTSQRRKKWQGWAGGNRRHYKRSLQPKSVAKCIWKKCIWKKMILGKVDMRSLRWEGKASVRTGLHTDGAGCAGNRNTNGNTNILLPRIQIQM